MKKQTINPLLLHSASANTLCQAVIATLFLALSVSTTRASEPTTITHGDLVISTPFVFVSPPAALTAGGYLSIKNNGENDEVLIGGTAIFAETTEIHEMKMVDNVMKMRELKQGVVIPAGESIELKPGGMHVMFMGLIDSLLEGIPVHGTLEFKDAGTVEVEYQVLDRGKHMTDKKHKHKNH